MANGRIWTPEDREDAFDSYLRGESQASIAERLGRTPCAIGRLLNYRDAGPQQRVKRHKTKRDCLRCEGPFMSEGDHNRICDSCKRNDEYMPAGHLQMTLGPNHSGRFG